MYLQIKILLLVCKSLNADRPFMTQVWVIDISLAKVHDTAVQTSCAFMVANPHPSKLPVLWKLNMTYLQKLRYERCWNFVLSLVCFALLQ